MTLKLNEFHLDSYDERHVLNIALDFLPSPPRIGRASLKLRLSQTECQPNGCSICRPDLNLDYDDQYPDDYDDR